MHIAKPSCNAGTPALLVALLWCAPTMVHVVSDRAALRGGAVARDGCLSEPGAGAGAGDLSLRDIQSGGQIGTHVKV